MRISRRSRRSPTSIVTLALAAAILVPASADAAATRTWVSGVGDDAEPCSRTAPCKTFAGAISKTEAGGEINALDSGGFGAVTITKSITISGDGVTASVLNVNVNGIIVNSPTAEVTLRGLSVNGGGQVGPARTCSMPNGINGVRIDAARSVRIQDVTIGGQAQAGVVVRPSAGATQVLIDQASIYGVCGAAVDVVPSATGSADVTVRNSAAHDAGVGLRVNSAGRAWISGSSIVGSVIGLQALGTGTITEYFGTNEIHGNGTDGAATSVIGAPVPGPPGPAGAAGPAGPVGPSAPLAGPLGTDVAKTADESSTCTVPKVTGLTRSAASKRLKAAGCRVGKVTRKRTTKKRVGRVIKQSRKAGSTVTEGTKVHLTVGRKR